MELTPRRFGSLSSWASRRIEREAQLGRHGNRGVEPESPAVPGVSAGVDRAASEANLEFTLRDTLEFEDRVHARRTRLDRDRDLPALGGEPDRPPLGAIAV